MLLDENSSASGFLLPQPVGRYQLHRLQPEFGVPVLMLHVDMGRLHPLVTEEEKAKPLNEKQRRHRCGKVPRRAGLRAGCNDAPATPGWLFLERVANADAGHLLANQQLEVDLLVAG